MDWFEEYMAKIEAEAEANKAKDVECFKGIQSEMGITEKDIDEAESFREAFHEANASNGYAEDPIFF